MFNQTKLSLLVMCTTWMEIPALADDDASWLEVEAVRQKGSRTSRVFDPNISREFRKRRDASVKALVDILRNEKLSRNARVEAAILLGDLRAPEAVDALLENVTLDPEGLRPINNKTSSTVYLCFDPLVKIGKPVSRKAMQQLRTETDPRRRSLIAEIVGRIEGRQVGRFLFQSEIARAESPVQRRNLQAALEKLLAYTANERDTKVEP